MRLDFRGIWMSARNITIATVRGELPLRLKLDKILPQILVLAAVMSLSIFLNLHFEKTMVVREENKVKIKDLEIKLMQEEINLAKAQEQVSIDKALAAKKMELGRPQRPARMIR